MSGACARVGCSVAGVRAAASSLRAITPAAAVRSSDGRVRAQPHSNQAGRNRRDPRTTLVRISRRGTYTREPVTDAQLLNALAGRNDKKINKMYLFGNVTFCIYDVFI